MMCGKLWASFLGKSGLKINSPRSESDGAAVQVVRRTYSQGGLEDIINRLIHTLRHFERKPCRQFHLSSKIIEINFKFNTVYIVRLGRVPIWRHWYTLRVKNSSTCEERLLTCSSFEAWYLLRNLASYRVPLEGARAWYNAITTREKSLRYRYLLHETCLRVTTSAPYTCNFIDNSIQGSLIQTFCYLQLLFWIGSKDGLNLVTQSWKCRMHIAWAYWKCMDNASTERFPLLKIRDHAVYRY